MARVLQEYAVLLYQARLAAGYETRLNAAAKSACCSIEQLGRYERGEMLPKIETAACLARAYRCDDIITKRVELAKEKPLPAQQRQKRLCRKNSIGIIPQKE